MAAWLCSASLRPAPALLCGAGPAARGVCRRALRGEPRPRLGGREASAGPRRVGAEGSGERGLAASLQPRDVERALPLLPGTLRCRPCSRVSRSPGLPLGTAPGSDPTPCASSRSGRPEAAQPRRQGPRRPRELTRTARSGLDLLGPRVREPSPSPSPEAAAERRAQWGADPRTRRGRSAHQPRPRPAPRPAAALPPSAGVFGFSELWLQTVASSSPRPLL